MSAHLHVSRLHHGRCVSISDVRCRPYCRECGGEEYSEAHQIVFVRTGVFVKRCGRREIVADPNHVLFFNRHETYRCAHPVDGGDDCAVFVFRPEVLREVIGVYEPSVEDADKHPFRFTHTVSEQPVFLLQQRLRQRLLSGAADGLMIEECALDLLATLIRHTYRGRGIQPRRTRAATAQAHREQAEKTRLLLAQRYAEDLGLEDIARAVHSSPFQLARVFHRETGLPMHQYRSRLRLRAALERLVETGADLTALALDLGFSSHSHFTTAFHRAFGITPSEFRRRATPKRLREMSRNLKADATAAA